ncbi:uncharacterized protein DNG_04170 [Cephalotrichum gorgonifer]|uniref:Uncharacterized protein n=1 Tax=Cephalotrichum gorgonifer TaxID=2041049 RepID=A0AAE8SUA0_9PEZI|nr:uncharacterized protein DNG_04170 [Cephalotrichum gorgonifer]
MAMNSPPNYNTRDGSGLEVVPDHRADLEVVHGPGAGYKPYHEAAGAAAAANVSGGSGEKKKIFGLERWNFILLFLLILVIVVAAVGGGVGGSMAVTNAYDRGYAEAESKAGLSPPSTGNSNDDPSSGDDNASSSSSTSSPAPTQTGRISLPATAGLVPLDCPALDETTATVSPQSKEYTFKARCGVDSATGEGSSNIMTLLAYRYEDCLKACASVNERGNIGDNSCGAVHYHADLRFVASHGGNCWLKKGVKSFLIDDGDGRNLHVFAELVT